MHPLLFEYKFIKLHTYGFFIVVGFLCGLFLIRRKSKKLGWNLENVSDVAFWALLGGFVGGRVLYIFTRWSEYSKDPLEMFKFWEGGLVFYGGLIGGTLTLIWRAKRYKIPILQFIDLVAPSLALGHAFGRIGCFMAGCCFGQSCPADNPFAVIFTHPLSIAPLNQPLHPAQLYDAFNALTVFFILEFLYPRRKFLGQMFATYGILYSIGRYFVESYRGDKIRGFLIENVLSTSQFISIGIFLFSAFLFVHYKRLNRKA
ncbi:MAG: prolipoprotein diacylglyceryl transferase [Pseudomonadota bacterium]|nr:prolipoprotein diacylglyceryl transferase [Pseudomonadota bacterium]